MPPLAHMEGRAPETVSISGVKLKLGVVYTQILVEIGEQWIEVLRLFVDQHRTDEEFEITTEQILTAQHLAMTSVDDHQ